LQTILSKTSFIKGNQCPKQFYLYKHYPHLRDKPESETRYKFERGHKVGLLAQQLFPNGSLAGSNPRNVRESIEKTQQLMNDARVKFIYEAAFVADNTLIFLDVLERHQDGWVAYEVKSSIKISQTYRLDAALQYYVIKKSGINLIGFRMITMNGNYVRKKELNLSQLFTITDLTTECEKQEEYIGQKIAGLLTVNSAGAIPLVSVGEHCSSPYACDFMSTCWVLNKDYSPAILPGLGKARFAEWYNKGIRDIRKIEKEKAELNAFQQTALACYTSGENYIQQQFVKEWFENISYPIAFLDFELFMPAIPLYEGCKPFHHLPFMFSVLYMNDKEDQHSAPESYITRECEHPLKQIIEPFIKSASRAKTIVVFDSNAEHASIQQMIDAAAEYKQELSLIKSRIIDLKSLFDKQHVFLPGLKGSASLKSMVDLLQLNAEYGQLRIRNGFEAASAYEELHEFKDLFRNSELREALVDYNNFDVKILKELFIYLKNLV
jgi:hypothetical protein